MIRTVVSGVGSYVPPNVVTNQDLAKLMTTSDQWIRERTGIRERRFAGEGVQCSDLAIHATRRALEDAKMDVSDIELIIYATLSPDHHFPGTGCYLQAKLNAGPIGCLDIRNQCTGFIYGLAIADAMIRSGLYRNILLVGSEVHSNALDFSDEGRDVTVLFGDAAGAVILSAYQAEENDRGLHDIELHADGRFARSLRMDVWDIAQKPFISEENIKSRMIYPYMDGRTVFKHAVTRLVEVITATLSRNNLTPGDIDYVVPHQANIRINQMVAHKLGFPESKFLHNMERYGNTTAASIPLLLDESVRQGTIRRGDRLLLAAFGSGFTWGTALLTW